MSEDEPKATLDLAEAGWPGWEGPPLLGDSKAVTVTCDKAPGDDRTQSATESLLPADDDSE